ncbi:MAG: VOC family protein [Chloroflexi bacterium]|nr:VOC family protein [Chloroflexota bacterium]
MELGTFSVSLGVKDIEKSLDFYLKFGFEIIDGGHMNEEFADTDTDKWRILRNGTTNIGLFQGVFDGNILTFIHTDLRPLQAELKAAGVQFDTEADMTTTGPCSATLTDPDGNAILFDQHY